MLFDKRELRQHCINKGKEHYIRYIERYLSLTAQGKIDLFEKATIHNLLKEPLFSEEETWWQKIVRIIKNNLPHNIIKRKWFDAFLFFNEHEEEEMSKIYKRMGLPKNGIRPDDC
jgi:hypothetical protein